MHREVLHLHLHTCRRHTSPAVITDDFTSEFDPFSPQFGEKFSPPDLPVSIKDWTGTEIIRMYADHWGAYNGMTYSTWEVNPPNPTGYAPTMMVMCMNDPGTGPDAGSAVSTRSYSQFCYELPFMPGHTQYLDTPVVPTSAFAGAGYNNPDCAYPAATPAISEIDGDGIGPWVSAAGTRSRSHSLGDQMFRTTAYSGPSATTAPYNQKTITRHYGFGALQGTGSVVRSAGYRAHSDELERYADHGHRAQRRAGLRDATAGAVRWLRTATRVRRAGHHGRQRQTVCRYRHGHDRRQSSDPRRRGCIRCINEPIWQSAIIDAAAPGDLIIVPPGYLQRIVADVEACPAARCGAASSIINANTHPAGKLDPLAPARSTACSDWRSTARR